jgi:hypothetical protein
VVLATDIFDKELNDLRKMRWERAFSGDRDTLCSNDSDLRATIVIEHIIQASDVSHTMQHWHVYQKWNKCLFREMHLAYRTGRMAKDPVTFWYQGEIGFFDNYGKTSFLHTYHLETTKYHFALSHPSLSTLSYPAGKEAQGMRSLWCQ